MSDLVEIKLASVSPDCTASHLKTVVFIVTSELHVSPIRLFSNETKGNFKAEP